MMENKVAKCDVRSAGKNRLAPITEKKLRGSPSCVFM